jgi:hypothetical protein
MLALEEKLYSSRSGFTVSALVTVLKLKLSDVIKKRNTFSTAPKRKHVNGEITEISEVK